MAGDDPDRTVDTVRLPPGSVPEPASLVWVAGARRAVSLDASPSTITSAADALREEEVERTRLFIRMGWVLTLAVIATVPFVDAPRVMSIVFVTGLVIGMVVSYGFYRAFADPRRYTELALMALALLCMINGHIGVLYYGPYSAAPLIVVVGIHFVARTEAARIARWIVVSAMITYAALSAAIIAGLFRDPGVFASDRVVDRASLVVATVFVLGTYALAYYMARVFRVASLASIEDLQLATRLASQRQALMDELRADLDRALRVGGPGRYTDQIVGSYRLGVVIGRGATGEIYDGVHVDTAEVAAVKLLRRELVADPTHVTRFLREARASGALDTPHVVRVVAASSDDAALPYIAMERLHGQTLADVLRGAPRLAGPAVVELCRHVAIGIDAAAAAGIVHRDLKPQNLFCCDDGTWKILDFGIASLADDSGVLTQGGVVGTPHYMAPEQAQGHRVDTRADIYALGAIATRCLTGRYPFSAADTPALLYAVVHAMPARPGSLAELDPDVDRWCALALAKAPADRFATAVGLADALADALAGGLDGALRERAITLAANHPWAAP